MKDKETNNEFIEGFAQVKLNNEKEAFVDKNGRLQKENYKDAGDFHEGFALVKLDDGTTCFIDHDGNLCLSKKEWIERISKAPRDYKLIPPQLFDDKDFMKKINKTLEETLSVYTDTVHFNSENLAESEKELQKRAVFVNEIMEIVNAKKDKAKNKENNTNKKSKSKLER